MNSNESGSLRAQSASAECYAAIAKGFGHSHLINAKVTFGSHKYSGGNAWTQDIHEVGFPTLFPNVRGIITVTYKAVALTFRADKMVEGGHLVQHRQCSLVTLFHSSDYDFLDTFRFYSSSLAELAIQEREFIKTDFRSFFGHPLCTLVQLCGSHGQMEVALPGSRLRHSFEQFVTAVMVGGGSEPGTIKRTATIHQPDLITGFESEHTHCMASFILGQFATHLGIEEETYFLHLRSGLCL